MIWSRWHWLDDALLPLLVVVIRLCWLWPWLEVSRRWLTPIYPSAWLPIWSIPVLFLGGTLVTRVALARARTLDQDRAWVAGIGLAAVLWLLWWQFARDAYSLADARWLWQMALALTDWRTELPPPVLTLLVAAGIWLRSVLDGRRQWRRDDVWSTCATGFIAFALLAMAGQLDPMGLPPQAGGWMIALIAVGLSALALSSLELARSGGWGTQKDPRPPLQRDWLMSVVLVIAGVLVTGLALGALFTPAMVAHALGWSTVVLRWLAALVGYLLLALVYVVFLLLTPLIDWLRAHIGEAIPPEPMEMGGFQQQFDQLARQPAAELPPLAAETIRWLGLSGVLIVILVIFALALRYFRASSDDEGDETRESILTLALLQDQLSSLWRGWLHRLRRLSRTQFSPFLSLDGEQENRRAIRAIYQSLLILAGSLGRSRSPSQTPMEYQTMLTESWPAEETAWSTLTEEYVGARYGPQAPSSEQVAHMRQAWSQAQAVLSAQAAGEANTTPEPHTTDIAADTPVKSTGDSKNPNSLIKAP